MIGTGAGGVSAGCAALIKLKSSMTDMTVGFVEAGVSYEALEESVLELYRNPSKWTSSVTAVNETTWTKGSPTLSGLAPGKVEPPTPWYVDRNGTPPHEHKKFEMYRERAVGGCSGHNASVFFYGWFSDLIAFFFSFS